MIIYRLLLILFSPLIALHALYKGVRFNSPAYLMQRLGFGFSGLPKNCHWLHCASVGETIAALPLIEELRRRKPEQCFLITTNTVTGAAIVQRQRRSRPWLQHCFLPIDWRSAISRFLRDVQPSQLTIIETELWPNLIELCHRHDLTIKIANGRLSTRTTHSNRWLRSVYAKILAYLDHCYARSQADADAYIELGVPKERVSLIGNLKFAAPSLTIENQNQTERDYVLIASTHDDEEAQIARVWLTLQRNELLVIAPRHPERSNDILRQLQQYSSQIARRSKNEAIDANTKIYLLDTVGELMGWLHDAKLVVMGGSFIERGGHNILEAAHFGKGVLFGPSMTHFAEESAYLLQQQAAIQCTDVEQLQVEMRDLLNDAEKLKSLNQNASHAMQQFASVVDDYADRLV